ncbi:DNA-binding transcriptional regulator [Pseudomonas syringae pv. actinidiae]|uniref:DNA-binding transcriptional regulator n=1 Tax=Pseudomonas syringae pv. actinidiae TaxID=103796 RepID=A0AAN4TJA4_PSESF|nr:DNA-binding transcriptional regulator [Pseudomonas syringae pv. actinidiae]
MTTLPSTSAQAAANVCSMSLNAACSNGTAAPTASAYVTGIGKADRSTLPDCNLANTSTTDHREGIMYSGKEEESASRAQRISCALTSSLARNAASVAWPWMA